MSAVFPRAGSFSDRATLGIIFDSTSSRPQSENDGVGWINESGWKTDEPVGDWFGITMNADGRVAILALRENRCTGKTPYLQALRKRLAPVRISIGAFNSDESKVNPGSSN